MPSDDLSSPADPSPGRCLVVLGMHRSGTSVLMGTLRDAGVHIGGVLDRSIEGNRKGLQEAPAVLYMQEDLLRVNGGSWCEPPAQVEWQELHRSVRDLFIESRASQPLWGFKDPRTLLTLEGWQEVLPQLEPVGIFRHPLEVAQSLARRYDFPLERGLAIWRAYNLRLLELHRHRPFPLLEFEADGERVRQGLDTVLARLGLPGRREARQAGFFDAALRRHGQRGEPLPEDIAAILAGLRQLVAAQQEAPSADSGAAGAGPPAADPGAGLILHSTRLAPLAPDADARELSGIAARCDWVVLADGPEPAGRLLRRAGGSSPRHVFLSLREPYAALAFFHNEVLPSIEGPFRLISGSQEITLPRQRNPLRRPFDAQEQRWIAAILDDPRLLVWAAENLEQADHPRLLPLPRGLADPTGAADRPWPIPRPPRQASRPLRLLCAQSLGEGPAWDERRRVEALCRGELRAWSSVADGELPERRLQQLLQHHAFVVCVPAGDLDPSPMAWLALLHGAIPVLRSSALDAAWQELPVALVPDWTAEALQPQRLRDWQRQLAESIDQPEGRARTLERLGLEHWWKRINDVNPGSTDCAELG